MHRAPIFFLCVAMKRNIFFICHPNERYFVVVVDVVDEMLLFFLHFYYLLYRSFLRRNAMEKKLKEQENWEEKMTNKICAMIHWIENLLSFNNKLPGYRRSNRWKIWWQRPILWTIKCVLCDFWIWKWKFFCYFISIIWQSEEWWHIFRTSKMTLGSWSLSSFSFINSNHSDRNGKFFEFVPHRFQEWHLTIENQHIAKA